MPKNKPIFSDEFLKSYEKLDFQTKVRIDKSIKKILDTPELGKPLRYSLAGMSSEHVGNMRIIYEFRSGIVIFHKVGKRKDVYK